jgi:hypothetical protein
MAPIILVAAAIAAATAAAIALNARELVKQSVFVFVHVL